jgi:hypothetical protein
LVKANPIQSQSNPISKKPKMNVNLTLTKDYRKNGAFAVRKNKPNSNPISRKAKMTVNLFTTKDYENETTLRPQKTNPNKPNFKRGRLLIDPMLPLYKLSNIQYYSRHNFKVKFPKISIISILRPAKLTKYRWKILSAAVIFNPIKKLTITRTGANLKGRRVI